MKWGAFRVFSALSLLVAVVAVWAWGNSMRGEAHVLSFVKGAERYTLRSKSGQLLLTAPPRGGAEDAHIAELAAGMSNDDFKWTPAGNGLVVGGLRDFTPSWNMWMANWKLWEATVTRPSDEEMLGPQRIWLRAMEDPRRCGPAHMMLATSAEQSLIKHSGSNRSWLFRNSSTEFPEQVFSGGPFVFVPAEVSGKEPDTELWLKLRQHWHDVFDEPRSELSYLAILLAALLLPLAWLARPKRAPPTRRRWAFNAVTLISAIIFLIALSALVRSHWASDAWAFWPKPVQAPDAMSGKYRSYRWIGSSSAGLTLCAVRLPETAAFDQRWGYQRASMPSISMMVAHSVTADRRLKIIGFESNRTDLISNSNSGGLPHRSGKYEFREMTIAWWLVLAFAATVPLLWTKREVTRWRRIRREKRRAGKFCLKCGYDIRATPGQCPECGEVSKQTSADATMTG